MFSYDCWKILSLGVQIQLPHAQKVENNKKLKKQILYTILLYHQWQINFLICYQIVVLKEGKISEIGTYNELMNNSGAFAEFLIEQLQVIKL